MKLSDIIVHYRITGPLILYILLSVILGFIVGYAGYAGTGMTSLAAATAVTIAGIWVLVGAGYEIYAGVKRYRDE